MTILSLSISYPDFHLNDIIDPESFDLNNAEIVTKINEIKTVVNSLTDGDTGASNVSITAISPFASTKLQAFLQEMVSRLRATSAGTSGADLVGSASIAGVTGNTVSAQLSSLKLLLDAVVVAANTDANALVTHKTSADHDGRYYTKTELNAGQLDSRYYTEAEVNASLALKADSASTYTRTALDGGQLDSRYYTEGEVDSRITANANGDHLGTWRGMTPGEASSSINGARLDVIEPKLSVLAPTPVSLVNGLQVVNGNVGAPLERLNIKGRTLINLLGRDGNCTTTSSSTWGYGGNIATVDTSTYKYGNSSLKQTTGFVYLDNVRVSTTSYYVAVCEVNISSVTGNETVLLNIQQKNLGVVISAKQGDSSKLSQWQTIYNTFQGSAVTGGLLSLVVGNQGTGTMTYYVDGVRLYEIPASEKTYIDGLSTAAAQAYISAKYPYVDDVKHITAPYVIKYGENLLPTFNEWTASVNNSPLWSIAEPYKSTLVVTGYDYIFCTIPTTRNTDYTLSCVHNAILQVVTNLGGAVIATSAIGGNISFNSGGNDSVVILLRNPSTGAGTFTFSNPMLNLGTTAKPFKPRNDDMLAFPNVQLASSVDGTSYDTLFKRDGKYLVQKRFKDMVLDGSLPWTFDADMTGFKRIVLSSYITNNLRTGSYYFVKYDGKVLAPWASTNTADMAWFNSSADFMYIDVADTDSGWGETYTPTAQEIQAYFYGWQMGSWSASNFTVGYTGSGTKAWRPISDTSSNNVVLVTPYVSSIGVTNFIQKSTPYKLTYQLATPTFEEIQVEGSMSLHEGLNQIEVGQGVVVREKANIVITAGDAYINYTTLPASNLKYRLQNFYSIYKNGKVDNAWKIQTNASISYGNQVATTKNYDPTATYEVSYLSLDQYLLSAPVQAVNGETASNLKTVVDTLSANQADQDARISANELLARQIYNVPQKTTAAMTLYVDATYGADNNDGSAGKPFKTIQRAVNSVPQITAHMITINVAAGTYAEDIVISGLLCTGGTSTYINLIAQGVVNVNSIAVVRTTRVIVTGFTSTTTTGSSFTASNCGAVDFNSCITTSASPAGFNIVQTKSVLGSCTSSNKTDAFIATQNADVIISNSVGTGNGNVYSTNLGGRITTTGTVASGTTYFSTQSGGLVNPWGDNTQASRSALYAYQASAQALSAGVATKMTIATVPLDQLTEFATSRFTAKTAGIYQISGAVAFNVTGTQSILYASAYKNGAEAYRLGHFVSSATGNTHMVGGTVSLFLNAGDYIELYGYTSTAYSTVAANTSLNITRIA